MKIALFTCHKDPNYGSMLQAYALYYALKKLGYESEYIDYTRGPDPTLPLRRLVHILKRPFVKIRSIFFPKKYAGEYAFFKSADFAETISAFKRFHSQYIPVSKEKYYSETVRFKFDVLAYENYIVGSDQTWSPILYHPEAPYFLDFCDFAHKNSYAPSLGTVDIPDEYLRIMKDKLVDFDNLSCRELVNCNKLSECFKREVTHVLDPTLLLTSHDWDKITTTTCVKGDFILAYILGEKDCVINFAERLGKKYSLPVYYIVTRPKYLSMPNALNGVGPDTWISLIRDAKYIVTDSFHGCLFSINYNKNFYAFSKREGGINNKDNIRISEFLTMIGLESRFQDDSNPIFLENIDYNIVNRVINDKRNTSFKFLEKCVRI